MDKTKKEVIVMKNKDKVMFIFELACTLLTAIGTAGQITAGYRKGKAGEVKQKPVVDNKPKQD